MFLADSVKLVGNSLFGSSARDGIRLLDEADVISAPNSSSTNEEEKNRVHAEKEGEALSSQQFIFVWLREN